MRRTFAEWLRLAPQWTWMFTMGVVILAVAIPTAGLLYFMTRALNGERHELILQLQAGRQQALNVASKQAREFLTQKTLMAGAVRGENTSVQKFHALMDLKQIEGALILDPEGTVAYPMLATPDRGGERSVTESKVDDLVESFDHAVIRNGSPVSLEKLMEHADELGQSKHRSSRDPYGRFYSAPATLAALQEMPPNHPRREEYVKRLGETIADRENEMPTGQRMFLQHELEKLGTSVTWPHRDAEVHSFLMACSFPVPVASGNFISIPDHPDTLAVRPLDERVVLFYSKKFILTELKAVIDSVLRAQSLSATIQQPKHEQQHAPLASISLAPILGEWEIAASGDGADAAIANRIQRAKNIYITSAICGCLVIGLLAAWAIRRFVQRERDTQSKQDFLSIVSHELRTPLTSIRMFVDSLHAGGMEDPERANTYLGFIRGENERLTRLVENFLTFSRLESGRMAFDFHVIHPDDVADAVCSAMAARMNQAHIHFSRASGASLPLINGDHGALTMALTNLIDNALKYSGEEKEIYFTVNHVEASVVFAVTDNGVGMSGETIRRLGEKFYRDRKVGDSGQGGFGLGLHIVRSIVEAHDARLEITSTPGHGSRFAIHLPGLSEIDS